MQTTVPGIAFPKLHPCWLSTPEERDAEFFPTFLGISIAIQDILRSRIPAAYFENIDRFRDVKIAYPMLVYQASRSYRGRARLELTYDVLNPATLSILFRTAKTNLAELLVKVEVRLLDEGLHELAEKYGRKQAAQIVNAVQKVGKSRKCLYILIRAENVLVNALIDLGGLGALSARAQSRKVAALEKKWTFQLRRLYPGTDFEWLAPELMQAATQALQERACCD